jgi:hypothetical protein
MKSFVSVARVDSAAMYSAIALQEQAEKLKPVKLEVVERPFRAAVREALNFELVTAVNEVYSRKYYDFLRPNLPDPSPMLKHWDDVEKKRKTGQLFIDDPRPEDVQQGSIGDCYFDAALAAVAKVDPQAIKNAITDNGDGTYTVRFFQDGQPVFVQVDNELYYDKNSGTEKYGKSTNPNEMWVSIMEKAYAKLKGGYENIGNGGSPGAVMTAITGKDSWYTSSNTDSNQLWGLIDWAVKNNRPITAETPSAAEGKEGKKYDENGIASWHCYTIVGTQEDANGQKYVVLRNPWAYGEAKNTGYETDVDGDHDGMLDGNDGTFRITIEDFKKHYSGVVIGM